MLGGGVWPVVQRELRATARRPLNQWLRVGGAAGGVGIFCFVAASVPTAIVGARLFDDIHVLLLYLICGLVPALAADCIARERREGTLGLLFLTPLTASGIVLGKILTQVLRALTLWLAVLPLLTIPFIYGGVTWADVGGDLAAEVCAAMICLAAGVLASSLTENRAIAFISSYLLMAAFVAETRQYADWRMVSPVRMLMPGAFSTVGYFVSASPGVVVQMVSSLPVIGPFGFASRHPSAKIMAGDFTVAALMLLAALRFAGWRVERSWQDKTPTVLRQNLVRRYCTPIFSRSFARAMRRALEWNPIAWLQQYSWKARASKWGLCLLFLVLECVVNDAGDPNTLAALVTALLLVLAAAYTYAGVNGFLQEKKSGALELILVSPLPINQIIIGRVWGLWEQFLPSVLLLVGSDIAVYLMLPRNGFNFSGLWMPKGPSSWVRDLEFFMIYLTLPVYATACALRFKNLFLASALTWLALLLPLIAAVTLLPSAACFVVVAGNILSAIFVFNLLEHGLARRGCSF